jgi:hypothetical protein
MPVMLVLLLPDFQGGEVGSGLGDRSSLLWSSWLLGGLQGDGLRSRRLEDWLWGSWLFGGLQGDLLLLLLFPLALTLLMQPEHPGKVGFDLGLNSRDCQVLVALIRHQ